MSDPQSSDPGLSTPPTVPPDAATPPQAPSGDKIVVPVPGENAKRSSASIDQYRRASDVLRDTTKWVVAFVPGAGVVVALGTIVPSIGALPPDQRNAPVVLLAVAGVATATALVVGATVLAAAPVSWKELVDAYRKGPSGKLADALDNEGILAVYGYTEGAELFKAIADPSAAHIDAVTGAVTTVLDFATLRKIRKRFVVFSVAGVSCASVAIACIAGAQAAVSAAASQPAKVTNAVQVQLVPTQAGSDRLRCHTTAPGPVKAWLISGNLKEGHVIVADDRCGAPTEHPWVAATDGLIVPVAK